MAPTIAHERIAILRDISICLASCGSWAPFSVLGEASVVWIVSVLRCKVGYCSRIGVKRVGGIDGVFY